MSERGILRAMTLPALGVIPGRASGVVHLVDDRLRWSSGRSSPEVLALPSLWWPPPEPLPPGAVAVLLYGVPAVSGTSVAVPTIARVDPDVVREGETVEIDGTLGRFRIEGVEEVEVVTSFLERADGRILLLERSDKVGSFRGHWAGVSGYLEDPSPLRQAFREILEETGLSAEDLELMGEGDPVLARDGARVFVVHPFRFRVRRTEVRLDWEHRRAEWVEPGEIGRRRTVPKLDRVWDAVSAAPPKG
ncbi:MAG TPA: NUDIX domain-containing protein [Thermoplasmata archaeon]|nr:NUDIX domain-containing protein [Thermoplasmata archaeon]